MVLTFFQIGLKYILYSIEYFLWNIERSYRT